MSDVVSLRLSAEDKALLDRRGITAAKALSNYCEILRREDPAWVMAEIDRILDVLRDLEALRDIHAKKPPVVDLVETAVTWKNNKPYDMEERQMMGIIRTIRKNPDEAPDWEALSDTFNCNITAENILDIQAALASGLDHARDLAPKPLDPEALTDAEKAEIAEEMKKIKVEVEEKKTKKDCWGRKLR